MYLFIYFLLLLPRDIAGLLLFLQMLWNKKRGNKTNKILQVFPTVT